MAKSPAADKIEEIERVYRVPEREKVKEYLAQHPGMVDVLLEGRPHIELQFGTDVVVELRFPRDYEGLKGDELLAVIQSPFDLDVSAERFDRLWDEWFGEASGRPEAFPLFIAFDYGGEPH